MNNEDKRTDLLHLYKEFNSKKRGGGSFKTAFYDGKPLESTHVRNLIRELKNIKNNFSNNQILNNKLLVSSFCKKIMARSNRIEQLFKFDGINANLRIVGSSFYGNRNNKQVITYCFEKVHIDKAILHLETIKSVIDERFGGKVESKDVDIIVDGAGYNADYYFDIPKSTLKKSLEELTYIDRLDLFESGGIVLTKDISVLVTLLEIPNVKMEDILNKVGVKPIDFELGYNTYLFSKDDAIKIFKEIPYLVVSHSEDFSRYDIDNPDVDDPFEPYIPSPTNEPIVGVIDTLFAKGHNNLFKDVYFSGWVETSELIENNNRELVSDDFVHGTEVTSLIVDLPTINPDLDDGCGRFRVRHFGVATSYGASVSHMCKMIKKIVEDPSNSDIKVWNISLGSRDNEIKDSVISFEGALLDELQNNNPNIVFVISGTNSPSKNKIMKLGTPADSINSIVVNACDHDGNPASYSRVGPALSFFIKPDIATYGGDDGEELYVWTPWGRWKSSGTSLAAPLIARKMAFLMGVMNLDRDIAKALIIDSATSWKLDSYKNANKLGRGIVRNRIEEIVQGDNDEIKFFVKGSSQLYSTYTYTLPVPLCSDGKYHYRAKATLCYFPKCTRSQGVDYTNIELGLKFGRMDKKNRIKSINDAQAVLENNFCFEKDAREQFRKWDNIKTIVDTFPERNVSGYSILNQDNKKWGIEITYQDRLDPNHKNKVEWGLVVTLKATDKENRIQDFIRDCEFNGWLVTPIILDNNITIKESLNVDIDFNE